MVRNLLRLKGRQLYLVSALPFFFALTEALDAHAVNLQKWAMTNEWVELFNGRNLVGWTPKIKGYPPGIDERETFRVEDGLLKVRYDRYSAFDNQFGHLFFSVPISIGVPNLFLPNSIAAFSIFSSSPSANMTLFGFFLTLALIPCIRDMVGASRFVS